MILNSRNNNFIVRFQKNFFYPEIVKKYETYLKRLPIPYENLQDYMTAGIQAISFPSLNAETVEQTLYEDPITAKGGLNPIYWLDRNFTITFKSYEGYINYWVMFDLFFDYYNMNQKNKYLGDVTISFLDQTGFEFIAVELSQVTYTSLSELELNYSSNTAEFRNFTASFKYNYINIKKRLDN
jgi:hypothetical protein